MLVHACRNGGFGRFSSKSLTIFLQLVEFMLKKVIEEFGQRAQFEGGHVRIVERRC